MSADVINLSDKKKAVQQTPIDEYIDGIVKTKDNIESIVSIVTYKDGSLYTAITGDIPDMRTLIGSVKLAEIAVINMMYEDEE